MPRKANPFPSEIVRITVPPIVVEYLDDLVKLQMYGATPAAVAQYLLTQQIQELIGDKILEIRKPPVGGRVKRIKAHEKKAKG